MSILINESYSNKNSQLWRSIQPTTPAAGSFQINSGSQNMGSARSVTVSGLTIGQRYQFTLNWYLETATGTGVQAKLADGTNGYYVSCVGTTQPTEIDVPSGTGTLQNVIPGIIKFSNNWMEIGFTTPYWYLDLTQQITLTTQTTSLTFTIDHTFTSPSVTPSSINLFGSRCVYTQPIV